MNFASGLPSGGGVRVSGGGNPQGFLGGYYGPNGEILYPGGGDGGKLPPTEYQQATSAGYQWNPVQQKYERTPTSSGQRVNEFSQAAYPGLSQAIGGLTAASGGASGGVSGGGGNFNIGGGSGGPVTPGGGVAPIAAPDTTAATNAAYASAKDKTGATARAALTSLNDEMGAQGMSGSGAAAQGTRDIIAKGQGELGQVSREQAQSQSALAADFAKTGYEGSITQRGQDIQAQEANARLALEQRQQYMQLLAAATSGLGAASGSLY